MRVLIVSPSFGTFGGIEAFVCALTAELAAQPEIEVTLCFKETRGFRLDPLLESAAHATGACTCFVPRGSARLAQVIRAADIVHCQNPCIDVALLARLFRRPLALTIHNWRQSRRGLREALRSVAFRLADARWYNSDFVWRTWEPSRKLPASAKLPVVSALPDGQVPAAERRGFVFVARWIENKGVDALVEAYARARLDRSQWPLVLLGDGPLRPRIEGRIAELQLDGVELRGKVSDTAKHDAIHHARWMVTPPNTKEDLGLTPIEARHVGVPCIITRDGGLPEAGGKFALVCEPGDIDGLSRLLENAAAMSDEDYERRSRATREELLETLQPLSVYADHYRRMLRRRAP